MSGSPFMPHGTCLLWQPALLLLHAVSDALIALAYYSIPVALVWLAHRRRDLAFQKVFLLFGAFIFACGTTHVMNIWTLWVPSYWIEGLVKLVTAGLSVTTAVILWPLLPRALALPSPRQIEAINHRLRREIEERERAEAEARLANRDLEERVRERTAALRRSNEELQRFAYVASHDLQEPMRMVASFTQLLKERYQGRLDDDADSFIGFAVDGVHRMQTMISDLLSYARVETQAGTFEPADTGLLCDQAIADLLLGIEESGAVVERGALPTVLVDAPQIIRLFQNLIGNAVKFRGDRPPVVTIEAEATGGEWVFAVRDNGIGIEPRHFDRLFTLFQRLHTPEKYPGTGVGLAICKKIAERHGGRIWVESEPGRGSVFRFTLGARVAVEDRPARRHAARAASTPRRHGAGADAPAGRGR
jgi:signal transduction histidine kinase